MELSRLLRSDERASYYARNGPLEVRSCTVAFEVQRDTSTTTIDQCCMHNDLTDVE